MAEVARVAQFVFAGTPVFVRSAVVRFTKFVWRTICYRFCLLILVRERMELS